MTSLNEIKVGSTISFETIAPSIINHKYSRVRFDGIVPWSVARSFDDIATKHRALYPSMNHAEVADDYRSYNYFCFEVTTGPQAGVVQVMGVPWVVASSVVVDGSKDLSVLFPAITPEKEAYLFMLLRANGFINFQVKGE